MSRMRECDNVERIPKGSFAEALFSLSLKKEAGGILNKNVTVAYALA
jgi:hypothetical protein